MPSRLHWQPWGTPVPTVTSATESPAWVLKASFEEPYWPRICLVPRGHTKWQCMAVAVPHPARAVDWSTERRCKPAGSWPAPGSESNTAASGDSAYGRLGPEKNGLPECTRQPRHVGPRRVSLAIDSRASSWHLKAIGGTDDTAAKRIRALPDERAAAAEPSHRTHCEYGGTYG